MSEESAGSYYYAGGEKVELDPDRDWIAVDVDRLGKSKRDASLKKAMMTDSEPLRDSLYLVDRARLSESDLDRMEAEGATQLVYRHGNTRLVPLPEVRVELKAENDTEVLQKCLKSHSCDAEIVKKRGGSMVLRPRSGRGSDALKIANVLQEEGSAQSAQARFLRMVPRPGK
jgi:hypothetical protein